MNSGMKKRQGTIGAFNPFSATHLTSLNVDVAHAFSNPVLHVG